MNSCWNLLMDKCNRDIRPGQAFCLTSAALLCNSTIALWKMFKHPQGLYLCIQTFTLLTCYHLWTWPILSYILLCKTAAAWIKWVCCSSSPLTKRLLRASSKDLVPRGRPDLLHYSAFTQEPLQEGGFNNSLASPAPSLCPYLAELLGKPRHEQIQDMWPMSCQIPWHIGS